MPVVRRLARDGRGTGVLPTRQVAAGDSRPGHGCVVAVACAAAVALAGGTTGEVILRGAETSQLANESVGAGGLLIAARAGRLGQLGIGEDAVLDVDEPPFFFAGHRVFIAVPEEALILEALEFLDVAGIAFGFGYEELDGAFVLLAAIDEGLFLVALRLHGEAGKLHVESDGDDGGHQEDQEEGEASLVLAGIPLPQKL